KGSCVDLKVPNGPIHKSPNEGSCVTLEVPDVHNGSSSSSSSDSSKDAIKDILTGDTQAKVNGTESLIKKLEATILSSSQTLSFVEYGNQFINDNPDVSLTDVLKEPVEPEVQSMVDIPILQEKLAAQRPPLVDTTKSKKPKIQVDTGALDNRVTRLEKTVNAMSRFNIQEAIEKSIQAHLKKNVLQKDVPDLKKSNKRMLSNRTCQNPSANSKKEKKKRKQKDFESSKKDKDQAGSLKKDKSQSKTSKTDKSVNAEETVHDVEMDVGESVEYDVVDIEDPTQADASVPKQDKLTWFKIVVVERPESPDPEWHKEPPIDDAPKQTWFNKMVNAKKNLSTFDDVIGSVIDFTNFTKKCLKKDKITKSDLEGPVFKLKKGRHKKYIKLEYNFEKCYLALTNKLDWVNPEGDRTPHDISKPLPLHSAPNRLTILVDFFFYKDLEYLSSGNLEIKYTYLTKPKDASIIRILVDKQFGRGYLKEIVVRRANQKEYTLKEPDFPRLHLNDIEDMYLLYAQKKLHHLTGDVQTDRVRCVGLDIKEPYTMFYKPRGVVYLNKDNKKYLIRADEVYKFRDGTLKKVHDKLDYMLHNFKLGYNKGMPKRPWIDKDKTLLKRRIMRSLECYVGGRNIETDYSLLT
ncbi:hypothetical protein Tco_1176067, partial [Tanacetum coccineum]